MARASERKLPLGKWERAALAASFFLRLFFFFFFMWTIFKAFIEFVTILLLLYVLVFWTGDMWNLATRPGIEPAIPALEAKVLTTRPPGKSHGCFISEGK